MDQQFLRVSEYIERNNRKYVWTINIKEVYQVCRLDHQKILKHLDILWKNHRNGKLKKVTMVKALLLNYMLGTSMQKKEKNGNVLTDFMRIRIYWKRKNKNVSGQ